MGPLADGPIPEGDFTVVSTLHLGDSVEYRMIGDRPPQGAREAPPSLEDGYVRLMWESRAAGAVS